MASVYLRFVPPDVDDLVQMNIYEGVDPTSSFHLIESVTDIGTYPEYIDNYTTSVAENTSDYFSIEFIDNKDASTGLSAPVKGDLTLAVAEIQQRVMERDSTIDDRIALQEAESAIAFAFPGTDPYDPTLQLDYVQKRGLTNLTLAMCYLTQMARAQAFSWVAGIVSMKISDRAAQLRADAIKGLIASANVDLGINFSMVAHLKDIEVAGGASRTLPLGIDRTRLLVELR